MSQPLTIWTKRLVLTTILGGVLLVATFATQRAFHMSEINLLVDKADEQQLSYELIIHNPLTNAYSFTIVRN
ncbi:MULTISPECIES: hypothetical protein [Exiguobacterium]|uniref:Uncharacterized protein n=1 Tax=Exiguobacterium aurantiacum TaxID=33987 RepID=A0A377FWQ3_9BACL|nr:MULTISPECIES: hypothetical protein [Exiguobacterium]MCT4782684.1 hypothetical protein [Exiguobacterium himgiriensis]STO09260.1 Uncharacterised protein [Exiguobacterium aurantiacum]